VFDFVMSTVLSTQEGRFYRVVSSAFVPQALTDFNTTLSTSSNSVPELSLCSGEGGQHR